MGKWNLRNILSDVKNLLHEFSSSTTIHGMHHIGSGKSLMGRFGWMIVFVLSVLCCGTLIHQVYEKWDNNPVIVSFDDTPTPVWKIPHPAITICSENKVKADVMNFTDDLYTWVREKESERKTMDLKRIDQLMAVLQICDNYFIEYYDFSNKTIDVVALLSNVSIRTTFFCPFEPGICADDYFTFTLTENGICRTYNGFSTHDMFNDGVLHNEYNYLTERQSAASWSLENGYASGTPFRTHPARGEGYSSQMVLYLESNIIDIESFCTEGQGFKIILHSPDEYPMPFAKYMLLSLDKNINIAIRPQILTTSKNLANYSPSRRQCFFSYERKLKFFRVYNQNNCELECLTNYTLKECGCVKFSMPRSAKTPVCSTYDQLCVLEAHRTILKVLTLSQLNSEDVITACNCVPACSSIQYLTEITQSSYDHAQTNVLRSNAEVWSEPWTYDDTKASKLTIYFKEDQFLTMRRSELFGLTDFIANCGGILGLCLGVSFVSLVELLYYCVVRPVLLVKKATFQKQKVMIIVVNGADEGKF